MILKKTITWKEIMDNWEKNEKELWQPFYQKKGFISWFSWRNSYVEKLNLEQKKWKVFSVIPQEILNFNCGAFRGWLEASFEVNSRKFQDLIYSKIFLNNEKIKAIQENFSQFTQIIGFKKNNKIFIFEGNHRCIAISDFIIKKKINLQIKLEICLTTLSAAKEYPFIDFYEEINSPFNK